MDEELEIQKPEPKISDVEVVLIGMFYVGLDLIDLFPIAGDITDVVAAPMGFYYWSKGINGTTFLVAEVLDLIPGVQEIPSRTIGWIMSVWLDRHPKTLGKLEGALQIANTLEGNLPEAEGAQLATSRQLPDAGNATSASARNEISDEFQRGASTDNVRDGSSQSTSLSETPDTRPSQRKSASNIDINEHEGQEDEGENRLTERERYKKESDEEYRAMTEPPDIMEETKENLTGQNEKQISLFHDEEGQEDQNQQAATGKSTNGAKEQLTGGNQQSSDRFALMRAEQLRKEAEAKERLEERSRKMNGGDQVQELSKDKKVA